MWSTRVRTEGPRVGRNAADHPIDRDWAGDRALPEQMGAEVHRERTGQGAPVKEHRSIIFNRGPARATGGSRRSADLQRCVLLHGDGPAAVAGGVCRHERPRVDVDRTGAGVSAR